MDTGADMTGSLDGDATKIMYVDSGASDTSRFTGKDAPLVDMNEFPSWILHEDGDVLVMNKPGWLVCHPSKNGPFSSLIGAAKEYLGVENLHLVSRLDRETSGIVLVAKHRRSASQYQRAIEDRRVEKQYLAWICGRLESAQDINQPLARDNDSLVHVKQTVRSSRSAQKARTVFDPVAWSRDGRLTLCRVTLHTGRKHQIRVHARWMGYPVYGDKLYGPDETCYLDFVEQGWTPEMDKLLGFPRQALHAWRMSFHGVEYPSVFEAPLPVDLAELMSRMWNSDWKDGSWWANRAVESPA